MNTLCKLAVFLISTGSWAMQSPRTPTGMSSIGSPSALSSLSPQRSSSPVNGSLSAYADYIPMAEKIMNQIHEVSDIKKLRATHDMLIQCTKKFNRGPVWASAQARLGDVYRFNFQASDAEVCYTKAWLHFVEYPLAKAWAATQLGYICITKKKYNTAAQYFMYAVMNGLSSYMPKVLNGLGVAHFNNGDIEKAHERWQEVLKGPVCKETARIYYNVSRYHETKGEYAQALAYFKKSQELGFRLDEKEYNEYAISLSKLIVSQ